MTLELFFEKKKIDITHFQAEEPAEWERVAKLYAETGPKSFDHFMKFRFNEWRLRFPLPKS
jgi:hypothetical protein